MTTGSVRGTILLLLLSAALAGCGQDREQILIGKWQTSSLTAPITAFRLKEQTPSASPSQAMAGGRLLGTAGMEIRKDKTFLLAWMGSAMEGTWTFNRDSGELLLNVTRAQPILGRQQMPAGTWVAYLDPDNTRLRLYLGGPDVAAQTKKGGGPLADGIPLKKEE